MNVNATTIFKQQTVFMSTRTSLGEVSLSEVGGKARNLFRLNEAGFPVPPWCVVSSKVFENVIAPRREAIHSLLSQIDFNSHSAVEQASIKIGKFIKSVNIPESFITELFATFSDLFPSNTLVSVRSSVIGEDSSENSFAGQMDSLLNVPIQDLLDAVLRVWASTFSARALVYRHRKGISFTDISAAVIIQQMIQSVCSGVVFSRNPENGAEECITSAGFGLGEGVVANIVETDTYRIGWHTDEIEKNIRMKDQRVVVGDRHGNRVEALPYDLRSRQVLTDQQIHQLRELAVTIEECFGSPQDIEWAYDRDGRLFVLQARPIIFAKNSDMSSVRIWDNSNIVESYPGITLPLTFSFIKLGYENTFRNAALGFLFFKKPLKRDLAIFKNMIGLLHGRVYYNLLNWYRMLSYLPGFNRHKESWDKMIGISHKIEFPQNKLSLVNRIGTLVIAVWRLITGTWNARKFFKHFNPVYDKYKEIDLSHASEDRLFALYQSLDHDITDKWHLTLYNDFCAMKYYDWLQKLCSHWGLDAYANIHNNLLCGESGVESVAPVRSLIVLAEMVRSNETLHVLFAEHDQRAIWARIQSDPLFQTFKNAVEDHLQQFGDRGLEELKFEKPTFRDDPTSLIVLIKSYTDAHLSVETMENQEREIRHRAEAIVHQQLKNPLKRWLFWFVLKNAGRAIANRENMRFARSRLYGIVRRIFRRMGELLAEKGFLDSVYDIYYLTIDEVFGIVQGTAVTQNLRSLVQIRKKEYNGFVSHSLRERIETTGIPYLNTLHESQQDSRGNQTLKGIGCSSGVVEGVAKVVFDPRAANDCQGHILVAKSTDPGWVFLMISSKGIVVEKGSVLSHTAIIGRELGIPTIIGVKNATRTIPDGARVWMNACTGELRWE